MILREGGLSGDPSPERGSRRPGRRRVLLPRCTDEEGVSDHVGGFVVRLPVLSVSTSSMFSCPRYTGTRHSATVLRDCTSSAPAGSDVRCVGWGRYGIRVIYRCPSTQVRCARW